MSQLPRRTKIILGVTLVAAAVLLHDLFFSSKAPRPSRKQTDRPVAARSVVARPAPKPPAAVPAAIPQRRLAPPPPPDQPWGERDPFAIEDNRLPRQPKRVVHFSEFRVSGVVRGPDGYRALVNDHVVRPGDQVDGARIVRITSKGVELEKNGETRFLPLIEREIRR